MTTTPLIPDPADTGTAEASTAEAGTTDAGRDRPVDPWDDLPPLDPGTPDRPGTDSSGGPAHHTAPDTPAPGTPGGTVQHNESDAGPDSRDPDTPDPSTPAHRPPGARPRSRTPWSEPTTVGDGVQALLNSWSTPTTPPSTRSEPTARRGRGAGARKSRSDSTTGGVSVGVGEGSGARVSGVTGVSGAVSLVPGVPVPAPPQPQQVPRGGDRWLARWAGATRHQARGLAAAVRAVCGEPSPSGSAPAVAVTVEQAVAVRVAVATSGLRGGEDAKAAGLDDDTVLAAALTTLGDPSMTWLLLVDQSRIEACRSQAVAVALLGDGHAVLAMPVRAWLADAAASLTDDGTGASMTG